MTFPEGSIGTRVTIINEDMIAVTVKNATVTVCQKQGKSRSCIANRPRG